MSDGPDRLLPRCDSDGIISTVTDDADNLADETPDVWAGHDEETDDPVSKALAILQAANLMPPVTSLHQCDGAVVISARTGLTADEVAQINSLLAPIPHEVTSEPREGGILYGH